MVGRHLSLVHVMSMMYDVMHAKQVLSLYSLHDATHGRSMHEVAISAVLKDRQLALTWLDKCQHCIGECHAACKTLEVRRHNLHMAPKLLLAAVGSRTDVQHGTFFCFFWLCKQRLLLTAGYQVTWHCDEWDVLCKALTLIASKSRNVSSACFLPRRTAPRMTRAHTNPSSVWVFAGCIGTKGTAGRMPTKASCQPSVHFTLVSPLEKCI